MSRPLRIHAFCSIKGGVGKSTLAVACATRLARDDGKIVLIDVDLTGSSLADGLVLRAPAITLDEGGQMDLTAPATERFLSPEETERLRDERQVAPRAPRRPPPFVNDALTFTGRGERDCNPSALLWRHSEIPSLQIIPASPLRTDVSVAVGWLYNQEHFLFAERLGQILFALRQNQPDLSDVVLDLPPGTFGFTHAVLSMIALLASGKDVPGVPRLSESGAEVAANVFLVTTQERNALTVSMEEFLRLRPHLPGLQLLVNRAYEGHAAILRSLERRFGPAFQAMGLADEIRLVEENPGLARLFRSGAIYACKTMAFLDSTLRLVPR